MSQITSILADVPTDLPEELIQVLLDEPNVRIERIVSKGHKSEEGFWYDQEQSEWVLLIAGAARLQFEDETIDMTPGSFINIPAHRRHRVVWTDPEQPAIWVAVWW
jgi:cupin 2 domain-containing protein